MSIKTIKIFLASSYELIEERREFEISMQRKNDELIHKGIYLDVVVWEDFLDQVSKTRLQDEYNKVILESDIFIMLFFTKVGKFTFEEFEVAHKNFLKTGRPKVFTYFKNAPIESGSLNEYDTNSLFEFKKKLKEIGHYVTYFKSLGDLKYHFSDQLSKMKIAPTQINISESPEPVQSSQLYKTQEVKENPIKKYKNFIIGLVALVLIVTIGWAVKSNMSAVDTENVEALNSETKNQSQELVNTNDSISNTDQIEAKPETETPKKEEKIAKETVPAKIKIEEAIIGKWKQESTTTDGVEYKYLKCDIMHWEFNGNELILTDFSGDNCDEPDSWGGNYFINEKTLNIYVEDDHKKGEIIIINDTTFKLQGIGNEANVYSTFIRL